MTQFSIVWSDIEDPKAGPDVVANAAYIQGSLDACAGRIHSGVYGNAGSIPRIAGVTQQFASYPFFNADGGGNEQVDPVTFNGLVPSYDQYLLDQTVDGVGVDIDCRLLADGTVEKGGDLSNFSLQNGQVPSPQWFAIRWDSDGWRFIIFGDQKPHVALAQIYNMEQSGRAFDPQLYTYINFPGGDYYSGRDGAEQMTAALDALGVPAAEPVPAPAPVQEAPMPDANHADNYDIGMERLQLEALLRVIRDEHKRAGGDPAVLVEIIQGTR